MHSAAISVRSAFRPSRMQRKPWPSWPIRFSAGISRFSKNSSLVSWLTMLGIGRTVMPLFSAWRRSTMKIDMPSLFLATWASGVVRASKIIQSECCTRLIHTFWPLTRYRSPFFTALVLILVVSVPVPGSVTPIDCKRHSPRAMRGRYSSFCALEPWRSSVPMLYIWPWQAPELPPLRLISSMITEASVSPRPEPPYSCGISAAIQPALVSAATKASGEARCASAWRWYASGNSAHSARTASRMSWYLSGGAGWWRVVMAVGQWQVRRAAGGVRSGQRGQALHGQPAFMVLGPQVDTAADVAADTAAAVAVGAATIGLGLAVQAQRVQVERRPHGPELEAGEPGLGHFAAQQVQQQRGDQRAMHDQAGVAFDRV